MAEMEVYRRPKKTIEDLPEEMLVKIFSYISLPELDEAVGRVNCKWSRLAKDRRARRSFEVQLDTRSRSRHEKSVSDAMRILENEKYLENIRISIFREYTVGATVFIESSDSEKQRYDKLLYDILPLKNNLRTLHLELRSYLIFLETEHLWHLLTNTTFRKVTFVSRSLDYHCVGLIIRIKLVKDGRVLDLNVKNFGHPDVIFWSKFVLFGPNNNIMHRMLKSFTEFEFSNHLHPRRRLHMCGYEDIFFDQICLAHNLENLIISVKDKLSFSSFSNVVRLVKLKSLVLTMDYNFSRCALLDFFDNSNFLRLRVEIIELESKGLEKTVILKEGRITVKFSECRT